MLIVFPAAELSALPDLTAVYWAFLVVGGGLLTLSALGLGETDADIDVDLDLDVDVDIDAQVHGPAASSLTTWFSMQFIVSFAAVFGLVGAVLTHMTDQSRPITLIAALAAGVVFGQGVHQTMRHIRRSSGDSTTRAADFIDKPARVTMAVQQGRRGEIAMRVGRAEQFVPALGRRPDDTFKVDDPVVVVAYHGGVVEIVSQEEFSFLHPSVDHSHHDEGDQS